jgi:arabinofuranan 3-O-arabinosyltransferase
VDVATALIDEDALRRESVDPEPGPEPCSDPLSRLWLVAGGAVFAVLSFIQAWGLIEDDTKLPLIMTPFKYIAGSLHIWNQQVFGGSVVQSGLVFPMGVFFAITHVLHIPTWCAERIWLALLLTVGFWGVVRLAEALGIGTRSARIFAGVTYCVAPIVVTWAQTSADLIAVVLLPWVLLPLIRGSRGGSPRRAAAQSGLAVALMGGGNAAVIAATLPVGLIWLATRTRGPRRRALFGWWIVALILATFWWIASVALEGKYGFNYLPFTETSKVTTNTASAFEALRGASYWLDYYSLRSPLIPGAWTLVSSSAVIVGTAVLTAFGLVGLCRRIPERLFLIASLAFGVVAISIGYSGALAGPFSHTVQHLLQTKLAPFRNISKFSPDVSLSLALGVAWCLSEPLWRTTRRRPPTPTAGRWRVLVTRPTFMSLTAIRVVAVAAIVLASAPFWQQNLYRPGGISAIPRYWTQAGAWLDAHQGHQNAMLVPGSPFGTYTWGYPSDEPAQIVSDTSVEYRNLIPIATSGYIQMLDAVEAVIDDGSAAPGLAAYLARGGVKYVIERNDLNWQSNGSPPPAQVHQVLAETSGLKAVASFGPKVSLSQTVSGNLPVYDSSSYADLRSLEIFKVMPQSSVVQTYAAADPVVVSGDAGSLLPLSGAGVLNGRATVLSADPRVPSTTNAASDATWAITDGNQLRYRGFGSVRSNSSYLLSPGQVLSYAPPEVPKSFQVVSGLTHETVEDPIGATSVSASSYGSSLLVNDPEQGPASAFDQDPNTSWVANATNNSVGQWVSITFQQPIPMSSIVLKPLQGNEVQPSITLVTLSTDRGSVSHTLPVGAESVRLTLPAGSSRHLRITIDAVKAGVDSGKPGAFAVGAGITDVSIPGVIFSPRMKVPNDQSSFKSPSRNPPVVSFSRNLMNSNLVLGEQASDDPNMARLFSLPKSMTANIGGYVEGTATGGELEQFLQSLAPAPSPTTIQASASSWLGNLPLFRPENLVDASPQPWIAKVGDAKPSITLTWPLSQTISSISLTPSAAASTPTEISVGDPAGAHFDLRVPRAGGVIDFSPIKTNSLTIRFIRVAKKISLTPFDVEFTVPVGLSSVGVPGLASPGPLHTSQTFFANCGRGPTLIVDGQAIPTAVIGTVGDLIDFKPMPFVACKPTGALTLGAGPHTFLQSPAPSAFQATSVVIKSTSQSSQAPEHRKATIDHWSASTRTVSVRPGPATDLGIAQNFNIGWHATLGGKSLTPIRLDGWQQGFEVPAGAGGTITIVMAPDQELRLALLVGALLLVGLVVLAIRRSHKRTPEALRPTAIPSFWPLLVASLVILALIGGPLALVAIPLVGVARRWGTRVIAALAFLAFLVAGIAAALHPATINHSGAYALDGPAQAASVVALAAVLAALAARSDASELPTEVTSSSDAAVSTESDSSES